MKYQVFIPPEAKQQLREIAHWYRNRASSSLVAEQWYRGFIDGLNSLATNPQRCGLSRETDRFPFQVYEFLYGRGKKKSHRALFRIVAYKVLILTTRHVSQRDIGPEEIHE